ncbi:hypothetical protein C1H46_045836 [Malus baccata]|uniref:Uncharacterized protein n=1 Tax=Malus baccata TaxID=106549 RepID=A0A540K2Z9_MALBA|nr:hypothetical protein C1H46_045836 [Malus baccata]
MRVFAAAVDHAGEVGRVELVQMQQILYWCRSGPGVGDSARGQGCSRWVGSVRCGSGDAGTASAVMESAGHGADGGGQLQN